MVYTSATTHKMVYTYTTNFPKGQAILIGVLNPLPQRHIPERVNKRKLERHIIGTWQAKIILNAWFVIMYINFCFPVLVENFRLMSLLLFACYWFWNFFGFERCTNSSKLVCVWIRVSCVSCVSSLLRFPFFFSFFFFSRVFSHLRLLFMYGTWTVAATFDQFSVNSTYVYCSRTHKFYFLSIFSLKMGPTALFTHLKIILLQ